MSFYFVNELWMTRNRPWLQQLECYPIRFYPDPEEEVGPDAVWWVTMSPGQTVYFLIQWRGEFRIYCDFFNGRNFKQVADSHADIRRLFPDQFMEMLL